MNIQITNALLVTNDGDKVIDDGFINIEGDKIVSVGPMSVFKEVAGAKLLNACGRMVTPGLVNPHTHLYSQFARGMKFPKRRSFKEILEKVWWRLDKSLTLDDVYYSAVLGIAEGIRAGVTTIFDHHASYGAISGSLNNIKQAFNDVGGRGVPCFEVSDRNGRKAFEAAVVENLSCGKMFGLHASFTLSKESLAYIKKANSRLALPYHIHCAEGKEDKGAVKRLYDEGMLVKNGIAAHCIHINDNDISLLKRSRVYCVHNPVSNMNNAVGVMPYLKMCSKKIPIGIGTDGMSSGIGDDVKTATVLHKLAAGSPEAGWNEVKKSTLGTNFEMAEGILGLKLGKLQAGYLADIAIFDYVPFTDVNPGNYFAHILYGAFPAGARTVIVDGEVVMEDLEFKKFDIDRAIAEAGKLSKKLWARL